MQLSDGSSNFEGLLFSDGLAKYEEVINSGLPLLVSVSITKENEEAMPRTMINLVETLDQAIANVSNGLIIYVNDVSAVKPIHEVLRHDNNGVNKIYIKPELPEWDVRIELPGGFAFVNDTMSKIRAISGVTTIKEL